MTRFTTSSGMPTSGRTIFHAGLIYATDRCDPPSADRALADAQLRVRVADGGGGTALPKQTCARESRVRQCCGTQLTCHLYNSDCAWPAILVSQVTVVQRSRWLRLRVDSGGKEDDSVGKRNCRGRKPRGNAVRAISALRIENKSRELPQDGECASDRGKRDTRTVTRRYGPSERDKWHGGSVSVVNISVPPASR
ncbi:hypothetical protein PsorP6_016730 [Peronosclerospora sorghi]|uniref:Uncharacterized protein n=1 Tax=Peronosclerospora sorghi TaxID=230839 RepID=A0ACC0WEU8_9STRA|nr:hypothetical protein PsorP6_016730 [Peronosclerospora sorghi]